MQRNFLRIFNLFSPPLSVSDFTHELSKVEEQHADDLQNLVENYKRKTTELRNSTDQRYKDIISFYFPIFLLPLLLVLAIRRCFFAACHSCKISYLFSRGSSSLNGAWESLLQEVELDSQMHSDIASVISRFADVTIKLIPKPSSHPALSRKLQDEM